MMLLIAFPVLILAGLYLERLAWQHVAGYLIALAIGLSVIRLTHASLLAVPFLFCILDGILVIHVFQCSVRIERFRP